MAVFYIGYSNTALVPVSLKGEKNEVIVELDFVNNKNIRVWHNDTHPPCDVGNDVRRDRISELQYSR